MKLVFAIVRFALACPALGQDLVLQNATVIDGTGAPPSEGVTVVVRGGRIKNEGHVSLTRERTLPSHDVRGGPAPRVQRRELSAGESGRVAGGNSKSQDVEGSLRPSSTAASLSLWSNATNSTGSSVLSRTWVEEASCTASLARKG